MIQKVAALMLIMMTATTAVGLQPGMNQRERLPEFNLYHYLELNDETRVPQLMVEVRIANDDLQFERINEGDFQSRAEVTVELFQGEEQVSVSHGWQRVQRQVSTFNAAHDVEQVMAAVLQMTAAAGEYTLWVRVRDLVTRREQILTEEILLPDIVERSVYLSNPRLSMQVADSTDHMVSWQSPRRPQQGKIGERLRLEIECWSLQSQQVDLNLTLIRNEETVLTRDTTVILESNSRTDWYVELPSGLMGGRYQVNCTLHNGNGSSASSSSSLTLRLPGETVTVEDIDMAIEQLRYIASSKTMKRMRGALPHKRELLFNAFWKELDPTPQTNENELKYEYFRRVDIVDRNYSNGGTRGWRTDRGRIYITHGPPDSIEQHHFESGNPPYEIWEYYERELRFVFVDRHGFGDYRLTTYHW